MISFSIEDAETNVLFNLSSMICADKLFKDLGKAKYLCSIAEIYFRYFDEIKKDNKKWFFNPIYSIINFEIKDK